MKRVRSQFMRSENITERSKGKKRNPMTVPDQSLKIADVVDRFTRGLPIDSKSAARMSYPETVSHDSPDLDKIRLMDKMDKADLAASMRINYKKKPKAPDELGQKGPESKGPKSAKSDDKEPDPGKDPQA